MCVENIRMTYDQLQKNADIVSKATEKPSKCETIYANSNVIRQSEVIVSSKTAVPVVPPKKPALPPKPPNSLRLSLLKPKGKLDHTELSLKERLALFEKNDDAVLDPEAFDHKIEIKKSVTNKPVLNNFKRKGLHCPYVPHTKDLINRIHQQKTIICGNVAKELFDFIHTKCHFPILFSLLL